MCMVEKCVRMAGFFLLNNICICIFLFQLIQWHYVDAATTTAEPDLCDGGFDPFPLQDKRSTFYNTTTTINDRYLRPGWYGIKGFRISTKVPKFSHCGTSYPIYQQGSLDTRNGGIQSIKMCVPDLEGENNCSDTWNIDAKICSSELTIFNLKRSIVGGSGYCIEKTSGKEFPDFRTSNNVYVSLERYNQQSKQYRYHCVFYPNSNTSLYFQIIWYVDGVEINKTDFIEYRNRTDGSITDEDLLEAGIKTVGFTISCGIRASYSNESEAGLESKGRGRFVGLKVGERLFTWWRETTTPDTVINEGEEAEIKIVLNDRIGSVKNSTKLGLILQTPENPGDNPCGMSVRTDTHCGIELHPNKTGSYYLKIKGTLTERYGQETQVFRLYLKTAPTFREHNIWGNYSLPFDVYVTKNTSNIEYRECKMYSDPRLVTFNNRKYSMQVEGIYTMYKSMNNSIEVQVQTFRCDNSEDAYCVCGVVVRVGKTAFMINICHIENRLDVPEFIDYPVCGDGPDVIRVTKSGNQYSMKLPNQVKVVVGIGNGIRTISEKREWIKWLNIAIFPTVLDVGVSRGLCGNLTDEDEEEKVLSNGITTSDNDTFFMSWRVATEHNLFNTDNLDNLDSLRGQDVELTYQTCKCTAPNDNRKSVNHVDCQQTNNYNCTDDGGRLVNTKRCRIPTRKRRSLPSFFIGDNYPRRIKRTVGTRNGWTEIKIREYCQNLFYSADIVKQCKDIPGVDLTTALNSCMEDIQLTGSDMFALSTLDTVRTKCLYEATMNVTLQEATPEKPSVLESVKEVACPSQCSNNGQCEHGKCVCMEGFIGFDCSTTADYIPLVLKLDDDGYCDRCKEMAVFGGTFIESDDFKCQLEVFKVENSKVLDTRTKIEVKGEVESIAEVTCPIPLSVRRKRDSDEVPVIDATVTGYKISVSNTGQLYSKQLTMVILNSQCVNCNMTGDNVNCFISKEYCYTNNYCYRDGESNILNKDYICNSKKQEWVSRKTSGKGDSIPLEIIIGITTGGVVLFAVIVTVVVIVCKKRSNRKVVECK